MTLKRRKLDRQANSIESILANNKIQGRVWGGTVTPRFIRYDLTAALGTHINKVLSLSGEIASSLGVSDIRIYRHGGVIRLEVPRNRSEVLALESIYQIIPAIPKHTAVLGADSDGAPLLLRLSSPDVGHLLIAGASGAGKSVLLRNIILSLIQHNPQRHLQLALIDPKGGVFSVFEKAPHLLRPIITNCAVAASLLWDLVREVERRGREHRNIPNIIVVIDELADLQKVNAIDVEESLIRLTRHGREAGVHVIVSMQSPAAISVGGLTKKIFPVRLVGAVGSPEEAKVATGIERSGAERLKGRGDFLLISHGAAIRFQAAHMTEDDARSAVKQLRTPNNNQNGFRSVQTEGVFGYGS